MDTLYGGDAIGEVKAVAWMALILASIAFALAFEAFLLVLMAQEPRFALMIRNGSAWIRPALPYFFGIDAILIPLGFYKMRKRKLHANLAHSNPS